MWLDANQFNMVEKAALDSDLIHDVPRQVLLRGLPSGFRAALRTDPSPLVQLALDLTKLNEVERLAGGMVPIVQYLQNAAEQLALRSIPEAELFKRLANEISNRTRGAAVADLPAPSTLPEVTRHEVIVGRDDMVDFGFLSRALAAGGAVARILVPKFDGGSQVRLASGEPWLARGTAWIIAPRLVITNHHVINARSAGEPDASDADITRQAKQSMVEFDFDRTDAAKITVAIDSLVHASKALDYAILRLANDPGRAGIALNPEPLKMTATSYQAVNIIQHPRGEAKRIAFRNNLVTAADDQLIRYFTDTDLGSSGSPVCDDNWRVVALHRGAKYAKGVSYQGKETAYVNFGSQIQAILADVKAENAALHQEMTGV
ncbi:trypsin-like peptidase domain-containing protein [Bradyrhizobium japonicum]|uniref:trypsin-like peptidase domain-containing protein n=1 Tax=Bradyrhizobium japonicum TaxID=375 RepID=UPI00041911BC|nr:trypsin-like peptidase domain-containing protein [Bradyrhizobium japonicum]WLB87861.1 trypsin-like peptidase domain-containing protein [Bradyrhizobium japonicum USDA 135]